MGSCVLSGKLLNQPIALAILILKEKCNISNKTMDRHLNEFEFTPNSELLNPKRSVRNTGDL